ncbi:MAG TPA: ZIP family metal transporter [Candidatus Acidoferrales bacterium]|nr:ZIP family metal transporter [Candidatus Acidoferrales bacterium]
MTHIAATRILLALLLGAIAAAANVIGGLAIVRGQWSRAYLKYFIALGAGFMLAAAFLEMIPESLKLATRTDEVFFLVLGGYLLIHFFEHTVAPHFHFGEETHSEELAPAHAGIAAVLGLVIHTFFDGVAIASGVLVSTWLGGIIFLAVFLHKLPEGSTVASLTLASGQSRRVALLSSVVLGGATIAGVGLMYVLRGAVGIALPFSAGVTIYVAASDLMPEVNREPAVGLPVLVFLGVLAMLVLKLAFHL